MSWTRRVAGGAVSALAVLAPAATATAAVDFAVSPVPVSGQPLDVAVGDVDGANGPDIVTSVLASGSGSLSVRLNAGNGTFSAESLHPLGCVADQVELTDLGGPGNDVPDGKLDAAIVCATSSGNPKQLGRVAGDGTGAFPGGATLAPFVIGGDAGYGTDPGLQRMALAQLRAPGLPPVPAYTYFYNAASPPYEPYYVSSLCLTYDWQTQTCFSPVNENGYANAYKPVVAGTVADARIFTTGGTKGLVAWGNFGSSVPNDSERDFGPSPGAQDPPWRSIVIGDLAGDGADIITAEGVCGCLGPAPAAGRVSVLYGTAGGIPPDVVPTTFASAPGVLSVDVRDIDGDGKQDVIGTSHSHNPATGASANAVFAHAGNGNGGLGPVQLVPVDQSAAYSRAQIGLADLNADGASDAVVITDGVKVLLNRSTPGGQGPGGSGGANLNPLAGVKGTPKKVRASARGMVVLGKAKNPPTRLVNLKITLPTKKKKRKGSAGQAAKATLIGRASIKIPAGKTKPLKVRLNRKGRARLRQAALRAKLTIVAVATDGTKRTKKRALTIRPPRKKRR